MDFLSDSRSVSVAMYINLKAKEELFKADMKITVGGYYLYRGRVSQRVIKAISDNSEGGWGERQWPLASDKFGSRGRRAPVSSHSHVKKIAGISHFVPKIKIEVAQPLYKEYVLPHMLGK